MNIRYLKILAALEEEENMRRLPTEIQEGMINLSSNDYLGLNENSTLRKEFLNSEKIAGLKFSAVSSRLLAGNSPEYGLLEGTIARAYCREACLVYNSGYHANIGILPALTEKEDLILADKQIHASLIDGIKLSNARMMRYAHLDYTHLESLLKKFRNHYKQVFIVTESIFSMDGDRADLKVLVELKNRYTARLYVDEAHSVGVLGETGLGCAEEENLINEIDFIVGTCGKALASTGAFVVCDSLFKNILINKSRSLIYTTALPPFNLAWTQFIFERLREFSTPRKRIKELCTYSNQVLSEAGENHIISFITGSNTDAVRLAREIQDLGFFILPVRYPTVPKGTARLRISLRANLTKKQLKPLFTYMSEYEKEMD